MLISKIQDLLSALNDPLTIAKLNDPEGVRQESPGRKPWVQVHIAESPEGAVRRECFRLCHTCSQGLRPGLSWVAPFGGWVSRQKPNWSGRTTRRRRLS